MRGPAPAVRVRSSLRACSSLVPRIGGAPPGASDVLPRLWSSPSRWSRGFSSDHPQVRVALPCAIGGADPIRSDLIRGVAVWPVLCLERGSLVSCLERVTARRHTPSRVAPCQARRAEGRRAWCRAQLRSDGSPQVRAGVRPGALTLQPLKPSAVAPTARAAARRPSACPETGRPRRRSVNRVARPLTLAGPLPRARESMRRRSA